MEAEAQLASASSFAFLHQTATPSFPSYMAFLFAPAAISISFPSHKTRIFHPGDVVSGVVHLRVDIDSKGKHAMERVVVQLGGKMVTTFAFRPTIASVSEARENAAQDIKEATKAGVEKKVGAAQDGNGVELYREETELVSFPVASRARILQTTDFSYLSTSTRLSKPSGNLQLNLLQATPSSIDLRSRPTSLSPSFSLRRSTSCRQASKGDRGLLPPPTLVLHRSRQILGRPVGRERYEGIPSLKLNVSSSSLTLHSRLEGSWSAHKRL